MSSHNRKLTVAEHAQILIDSVKNNVWEALEPSEIGSLQIRFRREKKNTDIELFSILSYVVPENSKTSNVCKQDRTEQKSVRVRIAEIVRFPSFESAKW